MDKQKAFRFGIMAHGYSLKRWQLQSIEMLVQRGHCLCLVIIPKNDSTAHNPTSLTKKYLGPKALYHWYIKLLLRSPLLENINTQQLFEQTEVIEVSPRQKGKYRQAFHQSDIEKIKNYELDFILRYGFNILEGGILHAAQHGIWSFHHDDEEEIRGGPPGFWEMYYGKERNGLLLQRLTEELDAGLPLIKGFLPVLYHSYSTHLNELLRQGVHLLEFAVARLERSAPLPEKAERKNKGRLYRLPNNRQMLRFLLRLLIRRIRFNILDLMAHERWNIGIAPANPERLIQQQELPMPHFAPERKPNFFAADSFMLSRNKQLQIFYEDFDYRTFKGSISTRTYDPESSKWSGAQKLMEKDYHLAFPFVFSYEGADYLLPESSSSGHLKAYRLDEQGKPVETISIMDAPLVDAVIFKHRQYYWLFATRKDYGTNQYLFAYYASHPFGPYKEHRLNPLVCDAAAARMGGRPLNVNNKWYRFAQKNNIYYGEKLIINEITKLSPTDYKEEYAGEIKPDKWSPYNKGVHSIDFSEQHILIDAKYHGFIMHELIRRLKRKLQRHV